MTLIGKNNCGFKNKDGTRITDKNSCYFTKYKWGEDENSYTPEISYYGREGELYDSKRGFYPQYVI